MKRKQRQSPPRNDAALRVQQSGAGRLGRVFWLLLVALLVLPATGYARVEGPSPLPDIVPEINALRPQPDTLNVELDRGETRNVEFRITNDNSTETLEPQIYEALADTPPQTASQPPAAPQVVALPQQAERVDPKIQQDLAQSADGEEEFLVVLEDQPDLSAAYAISDWAERGEFVYRILSENAERSQRDLRAWLDDQGLAYRPFWIVNAIAVRGNQHDVASLAARADVAMLRANYPASVELGTDLTSMTAMARQQISPADAEWHIQRIGADQVWQNFGVTGQGITVANIDTGVDYTHPALLTQYRGYRESGEHRHEYNWFDPANVAATSYNEPTDTMSTWHGTHVMGTIVARGDEAAAYQPAVGVAPGASWIAAVGCRSGGCWEIDLIDAAQWMLAPTDQYGQNPRPDLRPHIVNNSWAGSGGNDFYVAYTTAWHSAGIFPVFAAGNYRAAACGTIGSPGDYADVFTIGATDASDSLAYFSSIGPSDSGVLKPELTAPGERIISTVGSSYSAYESKNGTSMAAPQVAGAVALLWSANPDLIGDYEATVSLLTSTATPVTDSNFAGTAYANCHADTVPNNVYGYGILDIHKAVAQARVDVPWLTITSQPDRVNPGASGIVTLGLDTTYVPGPGEYQARVLVGTGDLTQPFSTVTINLVVRARAADQTAPVTLHLQDDTTGQLLTGFVEIDETLRVAIQSEPLQLELPVRTAPYTIETAISGYINQTTSLLVDTTAPREVNFQLLPDMPFLTIESVFQASGTEVGTIAPTLAVGEELDYRVRVTNTGTQPLTYKVEVPGERFGVWSSDEPEGRAVEWVTPEDTDRTPLDLGTDTPSEGLPLGFEFRYHGKLYDTIYVSPNGLLSFEPLANTNGFVPGCLPLSEAERTAIVPLHADLDPTAGGEVFVAQVPEGFVVTFDDVPLHSDDPERAPRFTFQVILTHDDHIRFTYQTIGDLPANVTVGLQNGSRVQQLVGCGSITALHNNLTLEMRPQPETTRWIDVDGENAEGSLLPDESTIITFHVKWIFPVGESPYRSAVVFDNRDLQQSPIRLPVQMTSLDPPSVVWMPIVAMTQQY